MPDADAVAWAIVAACKETGEDPLYVAGGNGNDFGPDAIRARNYAAHALIHAFPDIPRTSIGRLVGASSRSTFFYRNSRWFILGIDRSVGAKRAEWWDDAVYDRVIRVIVEHCAPTAQPYRGPTTQESAPAPAQEAQDEESELPALPVRRRPVERLSARDDRPVLPAPTLKPGIDVDPRPGFTAEKRGLYEMLANAVKNTAAQQPQGDE